MDPNQNNQQPPTESPQSFHTPPQPVGQTYTAEPSYPSEGRRVVPLLIGGVTLAVLIFGAVYFFSTRSSSSQTPQPVVQTPTIPPSPTPVPDPTTNWKTYTTPVLGLSFKYPPQTPYLYDQTTNVAAGKSQSGNILLQNYDGTKTTATSSSSFQMIVNVYKNSQMTLQQYVTNATNTAKLNGVTPEPTQNTVVGGQQAIKGKMAQKGQTVPTVWLKHEDIIYEIQLSTPTSSNASWFDLIISTIHFVELPVSIPPGRG